jgi:hypothetical protein
LPWSVSSCVVRWTLPLESRSHEAFGRGWYGLERDTGAARERKSRGPTPQQLHANSVGPAWVEAVTRSTPSTPSSPKACNSPEVFHSRCYPMPPAQRTPSGNPEPVVVRTNGIDLDMTLNTTPTPCTFTLQPRPPTLLHSAYSTSYGTSSAYKNPHGALW